MTNYEENTVMEVGCTVHLQSRHSTIKTTITGETPTQWKIGTRESRYRKSDLCLVGAGQWEYSSIRLWTEQDETNLTRNKEVQRIKVLLGEVNYLVAKDMTLEQVRLLEECLALGKEV